MPKTLCALISIALAALVGRVQSIDLNSPHYYTGDKIGWYWRWQIGKAGLTTDRVGFNTAEAQWYLDNSPTCVGYGYRNAACDDTAVVCAGGESTYGFGVTQMNSLLEMIQMGDTKHYMCPFCPPEREGQILKCHNGAKHFYIYEDHIPDGSLDDPGTMSQLESYTWIECDCTMHYLGPPGPILPGDRFRPGSYWANEVAWASGYGLYFDDSLVTYVGVQLYYNGVPTCVAHGGTDAYCNNNQFVCAGGATYGDGLNQMLELNFAILQPSHVHPYCP